MIADVIAGIWALATGKITKRLVDATAPGPSDVFVWDEALKGFGLKISKLGVKTYLVQYRMGGRGKPTKRYTIGRNGSPWTPIAARAEAERVLSQVAVGVDPRGVAMETEKRPENISFEAFVERYLQEHGLSRWRASTYPTVASNLRRYAVTAMPNKIISQIQRSDIRAIMEALPACHPALPLNVHAHLSGLFSWAVDKDLIERSPMHGMKAPMGVPSRDHVITDLELRHVWIATDRLGHPFGPLIKLLILTGQRRSEVSGLNWNELDRLRAVWRMPGHRAKNKSEHLVPLSGPAVKVLDTLALGDVWPTEGLIFTTNGTSHVSGYSRAKSRLDAVVAAQMPKVACRPWRLHDLRRTLATGFQRLGVRFEVTEATLNHISGSRSGVPGIYQRHDWYPEKKQALGEWADGLLAVVRGDRTTIPVEPLPPAPVAPHALLVTHVE